MEKPNVFINNYGSNIRQRHLRNLRSILIRNICPRYTIQSIEELCRYSFFFTLHESQKSSAYYTSTKATGTLNPVWEKINFTKDADGHVLPTDLKNEFVCIRVWMNRDVGDDDDDGGESDEQVMVLWNVHFSNLVLLEDEHLIFGHNVILFEFDDGLYTAPFTDKVNIPQRTPEEYVNVQNLRTSYRLNSLKRLQLTLRAISEVNKKSDEIKSNILEVLDRRKAVEAQKEGIERMKCRIKTMKMELETREKDLRNVQSLCDSQHSMNEIDELALKAKHDQMSSSWDCLHKSKKNYFDVRDRLIQTGSHLVKRRKQLLTDMASIYPITKGSVKGKHLIAGVYLPNSEDLTGHDDIMLGVALGFTCHLVKLISVFLDVPLRYPIDHKGSRSTIRDDIIDVLSDKERDFPLYSKGRERYQFEYAVYILNKNIVQLRHYCGMSTTGLGSTLFNLHTLLDDKLGVVKTTKSNAFTSQHVPVIPSFGDMSSSTTSSFTNSLIISMASTPSSSLTRPMFFNSKLTSQSHNAGSFVSNAFSSTSDIPQLSSSVPTSESLSTSVTPINSSITRLINTRSLSPSVESLTSSPGSGGFIRRKLRAFKMFKTSSMNSSPALSKCNSKCQLVEKPEREVFKEQVLTSVDDDDVHKNEELTADGPIALEHSASEDVRTDATLNEVAFKLDSILKVSENQNIPDELCPPTEPETSQDSIVADDQNKQNVDPHSLNCNGVEDEADATGECSRRVENVPDQSSPPMSRNLVIDETSDNYLTSDDEVVQ